MERVHQERRAGKVWFTISCLMAVKTSATAEGRERAWARSSSVRWGGHGGCLNGGNVAIKVDDRQEFSQHSY